MILKSLGWLGVLAIVGCVSTVKFASGDLNCQHTVSSPNILGTAQTLQCWKDGKLVTSTVLLGTAIIEPVEEVMKAGAIIGGAYGILRNAPTVKTDNSVHLGP